MKGDQHTKDGTPCQDTKEGQARVVLSHEEQEMLAERVSKAPKGAQDKIRHVLERLRTGKAQDLD